MAAGEATFIWNRHSGLEPVIFCVLFMCAIYTKCIIYFKKRRHILQIKETADIKNSNQWLEKADLEHSTEALITTVSLKTPDA